MDKQGLFPKFHHLTSRDEHELDLGRIQLDQNYTIFSRFISFGKIKKPKPKPLESEFGSKIIFSSKIFLKNYAISVFRFFQ